MKNLGFAFLITTVVLSACRPQEELQIPDIAVQPTTLGFRGVPVGGTSRLSVEIQNLGSDALRISDIYFDASPEYFGIENFAEEIKLEPNESFALLVTYSPESVDAPEGALVIESNDPDSSSLRIPVDPQRLSPNPIVSPSVLDFGIVPVSDTGIINVRVGNAGLAPVIICSARVAGAPEITSNLSTRLEEENAASGYVYIDVTDAPVPVGKPTFTFDLSYLPAAPGADQSILTLDYDAFGDVRSPCAGEIKSVTYEISGVGGTSSLDVSPCPLDFGSRPINSTSQETLTLENIGELALNVKEIRIDDARSSPQFGLINRPELPLRLDPESPTSLGVTFRPETENDIQAGVIEIVHDGGTGTDEVYTCSLTGVGVLNPCPVASIGARMREDAQGRVATTEMDWALPLQTLILDGTGSSDADGPISDYEWILTQHPEFALGSPEPFADDPENRAFAQYFIPVAGTYKFELKVFDREGIPNCEKRELTVVATPDEAITIELTWRNPLDVDETDNEGADVDLHFVKIPSPWFDPIFDNYFGNKTPNWNPEVPSLDIDDTNGVGPETIQLNNPTECQWYGVGAHYFRETYGTSWSNVKIFINGQKMLELPNKPLRETDYFWDVARIHWPSGRIYVVDTIYENFDSDENVIPEITDDMVASGLCGDL